MTQVEDQASQAEERSQETRSFVRQVRAATRRKYTPEEKIRIVLEGFRRETTVNDLCRREGIKPHSYYAWTKGFMEAGKERLTLGSTSWLIDGCWQTGLRRLASVGVGCRRAKQPKFLPYLNSILIGVNLALEAPDRPHGAAFGQLSLWGKRTGEGSRPLLALALRSG